MPPSSSKASSTNQNTRSISTFFAPVKKPVEEDDRPMIKVNAKLKSINRPIFASKSSTFSLSSFNSRSSSTDSLTETFKKVGFEPKPKKPLIDLTTPSKRLKQSYVDIDDADNGNEKEETAKRRDTLDIPDDDSDDDDIMVGSKRVLRERKPMKKLNRIIFSSDEEAEVEEDEEEEEEENGDEVAEEGSADEEAPSTTNQANGKKRRQPLSDSEDDVMDGIDELYQGDNAKAFNLQESTAEKENIQRISRIIPNVTVKEIKTALREKGSVVAACQVLMQKTDESKPLKKPRLTRNYSEDEDVAEMSQEEEEEQEGDSDTDEDDHSDDEERRHVAKNQKQSAVVNYFNTCSSKDLQILSGCKASIADKLIELRPFADEEDLETKLKQTKGLSVKLIEYCYEMMSGYRAVDQIIKKIENLGNKLRNILGIWEESGAASPRPKQNSDDDNDDQPGMALTNIHLDSTRAGSATYQDAMEGYLTQQPKCVNSSMALKDYQILGVNWMLLLYRKCISGILADEMGLGKTAQVISFLGRLNEIGESGPHLIIVPSSTIQNWEREFERFCPSLEVRLYHGTQQERMDKRIELLEENGWNGFQVVVTTYNLAAGSPDDRKFFKKLQCRSMILDEGHMIKNCTSARYKHLMGIKAPFRLLLTGTPLQNNLQELVSLLTFIMPDTFANHEEDIRSIFKIRKSTTDQKQSKIGAADDTSIQVLAKERINRAKKMMTPFVLRRKKENVLKDLPKKEQIIERCDMTEGQAKLYTHIINQTKKKYEASLVEKDNSEKKVIEKKTDMAAQFEDMSNVVIHLRKAADHPLMFRNLYTDEMLRKMAKELQQDVKYWDSNLEYMYEDMTVMSDFELDRFCKGEKKIKHFCLKNQEWMDSGKIEKLKELLPAYKKQGNKVLIFSQFTKMLDILELVLETIGATFLRLDGETKVMDRQSTIDNFNENPDIDVFLLSTKAGGFGINLTSSNIVIMYDIDFNPQNDKQAEDRAHLGFSLGVGQTKDVIIHKLISNGSIEEYILRMANMKLRLDKNISSNDDDQQDEDTSENQKGLHSILQEAFMIADSRQK
ncbi:hypothetical protein [Parasitella parasitica]|uniref:DNA helicase n=1 Tax=Parasitella parasitica TaxID=35722 RepID=A0A0B7N258_9FUNG|nr:hypothetical protein [Parasitella parasitica]